MIPMLPAIDVSVVLPFFVFKFRAESPSDVPNDIEAFSAFLRVCFFFSARAFFHAAICSFV